jgi:transposase
LAQRSRIVLAATDGSSNQQIASALQIPAITVGKWRRSFAEDGIEGLRMRRGPDGLPSTISRSGREYKQGFANSRRRKAVGRCAPHPDLQFQSGPRF